MLLRLSEELEKDLSSMAHPSPGLLNHQLKYLDRYASCPVFREYVDNWLEKSELLTSVKEEIRSLESRVSSINISNVKFNSGMACGMQSDGPVDASVYESHDILQEIGGEEAKYDVVSDYTPPAMHTKHDLDAFFLRPIQIASFSIATGASIDNKYSVLDLYLSDPSVRAKLRNFTYLKAKCCVRISVSGTPFDYGRLMVAAYPWQADNTILQKFYTGGATWDSLKLQYLSQNQHATIIDLKENKPIDIEMPWISPMPVGRLYNQSTAALGSGTSYTDFADMWTVYIKTLNVLASVSSTPSPVYVYIYAYLKDVELGVPTATQTVIVTNSGTSKIDERTRGPVERMSSAALAVSNALATVPFLSSYARASSMVLSPLRDMAAHYGWSAPEIIEMPKRVKNEPYQNGCQLIQMDTGQKISLDPKQELSVSPSFVSTSTDELVIEDMCSRISYLKTFTWSASANPLVPIEYYYVHPRLCYPFLGPSSLVKNVMPTPMHFASIPFANWHGDIEYTFEVVGSSFHRGKLLVVYEPNVYAYTNLSANQALNKQHSFVWDIQETQRISFVVRWNFPRKWANNLDSGHSYSTCGPVLTIDNQYANSCNGFVYVMPFTKLQSPDTSNVSVNVYVRGLNMKFNRLSSRNIPVSRVLNYNSGCTNVSESTMDINESSLSTVKMYEDHYGEAPISIRSLLKRFVAVSTAVSGTTPAGSQVYTFSSNIYNDDYGSISFAGLPISLFGYYRYAFLAIRGGMRKRINILSDANTSLLPVMVSLEDGSENSPVTTIVQPISGIATGPYINGTLMFAPQTNNGIEFELPFYSNNMFAFACKDSMFQPSCPAFDSSGNSIRYRVEIPLTTAPTKLSLVESEATAEDFQLAYFLGAVPFIV